MTLADACTSATRGLRSAKADDRRAASDYLIGLKTLREVVIKMNMERVFGREYHPRTRMSYSATQRSESVRQVSATGEFLIAHHMGLLDAYRRLVDTGVHLKVAEHPSRLFGISQ
ncbi:MAG: hypothetical protein AAF512_23265 [Pseudomonadota bacterium]